MLKSSWKLIGFALVALVALVGFNTVEHTFNVMFVADAFVFRFDIGQWNTPLEVLYSIVNILVIIFIVRVTTTLSFNALPSASWKFKVPLAAALFGCLHWWTLPIFRFLVFGSTDFRGDDIFNILTWLGRWGFDKSDFMGYAPAALLMVCAELLRRRIVGHVSNSDGAASIPIHASEAVADPEETENVLGPGDLYLQNL